jgi:4-hydroxy-tetrahydrodipicolinate reductase
MPKIPFQDVVPPEQKRNRSIRNISISRKKDKPSGTAIALQDALEKSLGKKINPPISIRGGGVPGIHKISAYGEEEIITIEHTAMNRTVFARGALEASLWLKNKKPGLYSLEDLLK